MVVNAGKSRKNVDAFVILPPDARKAIDLLIETRAAVGVPETNMFVFARRICRHSHGRSYGNARAGAQVSTSTETSRSSYVASP
jgi:protein subunit release factor A